MTRKLDAQEPLLSAVARKLGQAAGTLANMAHLLTTEQTVRASHSPSKPESEDTESGTADSAKSSVKEEKSPATVGQKRKTKQSHAKPQKGTRSVSTRTASQRNTAAGTKRATNKSKKRSPAR
jgi:hypothetical protein